MVDEKKEWKAILACICFSTLVIALWAWLDGYPVITPFSVYVDEISVFGEWKRAWTKAVEHGIDRLFTPVTKEEYLEMLEPLAIAWDLGRRILKILLRFYWVLQDLYVIFFFTEIGYITLPLSFLIFCYLLVDGV